MKLFSLFRTPIIAGAIFAFASCRATPEPQPLVAPTLSFSVRHYTGSPLAGPTSLAFNDADADHPRDLADAWLVDCRVIFLEDMPKAVLDSLATRTRLIAASRGEEPVLTSTILTSGARVGVGEPAERFIEQIETDEFGRYLELGDPTAAIPSGVSAWFKATAEEWIDVPDLGLLKKVVSIHVSHEKEPAGAPAVVLSVEDLVVCAPEESSAPTGPAIEQKTSLRRELICLDDRPEPDAGPLVLVFPSPFGAETGALVAVLKVFGEFGEASEDELARCASDLELEQSEAELVEEERATVRTLASAFQALDLARYHRSALLFLASNTGAALVEDLALSADDVALAAFVGLLKSEDIGVDSEPSERTGWVLDSLAFHFLATLQIESPPLPPELSAILLRHAGEAGRYPGLVQEIVSRSRDSASLRDSWIAENRLFLEDSNPGARVRAYDWLAARDLAPPGFDPFGEAAARRKALSMAEDEREKQAQAALQGVER